MAHICRETALSLLWAVSRLQSHGYFDLSLISLPWQFRQLAVDLSRLVWPQQSLQTLTSMIDILKQGQWFWLMEVWSALRKLENCQMRTKEQLTRKWNSRPWLQLRPGYTQVWILGVWSSLRPAPHMDYTISAEKPTKISSNLTLFFLSLVYRSSSSIFLTKNTIAKLQITFEVDIIFAPQRIPWRKKWKHCSWPPRGWCCHGAGRAWGNTCV